LGFIATKAGYSQPCRASFVLKTEGSFVARAEEELDLYLVPDAILSSSGVPASMPILPSSLSGLVFERTEQGPRPIAGASIMADFTYGNGWAPNARTLTDATGRYVLCNMSYAELIVEKAGFSQAARRVGADTGRADVELTRR
jgi:hypothetical protein